MQFSQWKCSETMRNPKKKGNAKNAKKNIKQNLKKYSSVCLFKILSNVFVDKDPLQHQFCANDFCTTNTVRRYLMAVGPFQLQYLYLSQNRKIGHAGLPFEDGMPTPLDLRFVNSVYVFVKTCEAPHQLVQG